MNSSLLVTVINTERASVIANNRICVLQDPSGGRLVGSPNTQAGRLVGSPNTQAGRLVGSPIHN